MKSGGKFVNKLKLKSMLEQFYLEDLGDGDLSSQALFSSSDRANYQFISKANGVFCGRDVIENGFRLLDETINIKMLVEDGEKVEAGQIIVEIEGPVQSLLQGERVILNLIQRMSGIATMTAKAVASVNHTGVRLCDTRKTTPGLRMLEKYAVRCGGGYNHRNGLYDAVMLKDNHLSFSGGILAAVEKVKQELGHTVKVEVEIETEQQMNEAVEAGADIIMFDNRKPEEITEWIRHVPNHIVTEASGGITLKNLREYAESGVQYISLGILTHSVQSLDISAKVLY
jgi:nicotinate-nucleotide pyrophosphorylase (carboxylating)